MSVRGDVHLEGQAKNPTFFPSFPLGGHQPWQGNDPHVNYPQFYLLLTRWIVTVLDSILCYIYRKRERESQALHISCCFSNPPTSAMKSGLYSFL